MHKQNKHDYAPEQEEISTNHRRRLDEHFQNWITLDPNHHNLPDVDIRSPLTRDIISKQTETWKKIFIFERENDWKYIIHPYRQIGIENLSFWNQHITKTKLTGNLPAYYNDIKVDDTVVSELASSIRTIYKLSLPRENFIETIWSNARALVNNIELEDGQTDVKPEVLY